MDPSSRHLENRLARESSPYLLQHARNPVDWWAWGDEAIAEARRRDVPIFLSVGYSTCYWCHVMERESFEDPATGADLSANYVAIKVDREERPDVDELFMTAVQMLTGRGGWPMSVFIEPENLRPFWGGTYFPPRPAHGLPSFRQVLAGLSDAWRTRRGDILTQAQTVGQAVAQRMESAAKPMHIGRPQVAMAVQGLLTTFDRVNGGFGGAPKFPQPAYVDFLLTARGHVEDHGAREAIDLALRTTLDRMAIGGIHDHVGGGFHRYSVDASWTVPHFEKMLYDQGQLLSTYARAAVAFEDPFYARTARRIAAYVAREMTSPDGMFFTAQDAEVNAREGLNYLWTPEEVRAALPPEDAALAMDVLGLSAGPNFKDPHHADEPPRNVLRLPERPEGAARRLGITTDQVLSRLDRVCDTLLRARARREQARLDDKVLAAWNGMMIAGLAAAGRLLDQPSMLDAAERAARGVLSTLRDGNGSLRRSGRAGQLGPPAVLEDYAHLAAGCMELARARDTAHWIGQASALAEHALAHFSAPAGGFFDALDRPDLFIRPRSTYDGACPCAASAMLHVLVDLAEQTGERAWIARAGEALCAMSAAIAESPLATVNSTRALLRMLSLDEPALVAALGRSGAAEPTDAPPAAPPPLKVLASCDSVALAPDQPVEFMLRLEIAEGFHLGAADPGATVAAQAMIPTRLHLVGGSGVAVHADYPSGEPLLKADTASPRIYRGTVEFPVALELSGRWTGRPRLELVYQACDDSMCLGEDRLLLDVQIEPKLPLG